MAPTVPQANMYTPAPVSAGKAAPAAPTGPVKAFLFDMDGTLCNTDHLHFEAFQIMLREEGREIDMEFFNAKISGRHNPLIMADLLPHLSPEEGAAWSRRKEALFRELAREKLVPMPGLVRLLDWLDARPGTARAVVTNAPEANATFMLEVLGLAGRFDTIVLGERCPRAKPDPCPYETALELLGAGPGEALAFEDSAAGLQSATGAGIATVGVASTQPRGALRALGAALAVEDFEEAALWEALERWGTA